MIFTPSPAHIEQALSLLNAGQLVGLPTETVYGLAADASNAAAVARIYAAKGRPVNHPLIVHLAPLADVSIWARAVPDYAKALMHACWPGPLTLVLPRTPYAKDYVTGAQDTVALRCPSHPVAQALLNRCLTLGIQGLAAPSANRFGRVSPTTAQHVEDEFESAVFTLDGGACEVGIESTIVDCTQAAPRILRHGALGALDVARVTGFTVSDCILGITPSDTAHANNSEHNAITPRVSGSLAAHYAPSTPLHWCEPAQAKRLAAGTVYMGFDIPVSAAHLAFHAMPRDAALYAQQLYATLRHLDTMHYQAIAVEPLPREPQWAGVADRLTRAAASFSTGQSKR